MNPNCPGDDSELIERLEVVAAGGAPRGDRAVPPHEEVVSRTRHLVEPVAVSAGSRLDVR
jgi:hypothetical protein